MLASSKENFAGTGEGRIMAEERRRVREGDLVQLNSGGCKMTVVRLEGEGAVCVWKAGALQQTAWVSLECLVKLPNPRWLPQIKVIEGFGILGRPLTSRVPRMRH